MSRRVEPAVQDHARRLLPLNRGEWVIERARTSLHEGSARLGATETTSLEPAALWADTSDRGRGRHAHGFTFFADWVGAAPLLDEQDAAGITHLVLATVHAWDGRFGADRGSAPEMAYHDETTAQRLLGVIAALDVLDLDAQQRRYLRGFADRTAAVLADPAFHSGLNNHGMFQDLALLTWSVLVATGEDPAGDTAWSTAEERLDAYFTSCFTQEGVHVENTPTYHVMVARYLPILAGIYRHAGSSSAAHYESLLRGAEKYAVHATTPAGVYPPVSDTQRRPLDSETNLRTFIGGEFEFAATAGTRGRRPAERTAVFPASGYAMTRSGWGEGTASYVYFSCAYNADYHKHSDELSVYLSSGGRDLLCEAGAYGYNWKDPLTKHAYSSAAHNTLLVDGAGLPRTEPVEVREGALAPIDELQVGAEEPDLLDATGTTRRYPGRTWSRRLEVRHGAEPAATHLSVTDRVRSEAGAAQLQFLWHLGPDLEVVLRPRGAEVFAGTAKVMEVEFHSAADLRVSVVRGRTSPSPQGWYFPAFGEAVPAAVLVVDCWQADLDLATEVRLSDFRWGDEGRSDLTSLVDRMPAVPSWSSRQPVAHGGRGVLVLAPQDTPSDRERLTVELSKNDIPYWFVPGVGELMSAASPDGAARLLQEVADSVTALVRREAANGVYVLLGSVGCGFAPAVVAALRTGAPLLMADPELPGAPTGAGSRRVAAELAALAGSGAAVPVEVLVSSEGSRAAGRALTLLDPRGVTRRDLRGMLAVDTQDQFSDQLRNTLAVAEGREPRCLSGYDRRRGRILVELPDHPSEVSVALRVFHGRKQVAASPYTPGTRHALTHSGKGPHRVRVHVRDADGAEISAFTTGAIRLR